MRIGVIDGGISSEKEISILSGREIIANIDKNKYEVKEILIEKEEDVFEKIKDIDFAFIALHGKFGEDGKIQAVLETKGIPYNGCGVLTSALCMDKNLSKKIFLSEGVKTADWVMVTPEDELPMDKLKKFGYPLVVKPNNGGSSIGIFLVKDEKELKAALEESFKYDKNVLIEEYIKGQEITCSMLDGEILPTIFINPSEEFFDYQSKYYDNGTKEVVGELPKHLDDKLKVIAKKCWKLFNLEVYSRIDFLIKDDEFYALEVNTLPGMTANSLVPKSAKAVGIDFPKLLDKVIDCSLRK
ncbi:D-alanine--D-alanine ligase [Clostridium oryzae]|uniref:D-alanine--D-alanine ligase n=1 Tax=Clostridium oryzae TaxID=1450648 RepID=A0A1V4IRA0_9CLOT|nr:D-alanine--D-alanine ligase [Clostridium oryzae]OPJ62409.1 D-alanine--D-alanine ligase [Clostridium oryzae]